MNSQFLTNFSLKSITQGIFKSTLSKSCAISCSEINLRIVLFLRNLELLMWGIKVYDFRNQYEYLKLLVFDKSTLVFGLPWPGSVIQLKWDSLNSTTSETRRMMNDLVSFLSQSVLILVRTCQKIAFGQILDRNRSIGGFEVLSENHISLRVWSSVGLQRLVRPKQKQEISQNVLSQSKTEKAIIYIYIYIYIY